MAMRTYKTCYVNANRQGSNGVAIAVGLHPKWLREQQRNGSSVGLIDIFCRALRFASSRYADLARLNLYDLQEAVMTETKG